MFVIRPAKGAKPKAPCGSRLTGMLACLARSQSGTSAVEFALIVPVIIGLGMTGSEVAYLASAQLQVSQIAVSVADNASRLGQTDNTAVTPTIGESDVNSVLFGAMKQGGALNLQANGRVILSSLELDVPTGKQYLHWQRCSGSLTQASRYGIQGTGLTGAALAGVGNGSGQVTAPSGSAVMVAEVYYQYQGLFGNYFVNTPIIRQEAAFLNRDNRNLGDSTTNGLSPDTTAATC